MATPPDPNTYFTNSFLYSLSTVAGKESTYLKTSITADLPLPRIPIKVFKFAESPIEQPLRIPPWKSICLI